VSHPRVGNLMSPISLDALNRPLLTINEVAAALRVSEKTVQRRIKDGTIRPVQMGGRLVRISSDELARLIAGDPPKAPWNNVDIPE
jgi:excisionase family DNA binding protein